MSYRSLKDAVLDRLQREGLDEDAIVTQMLGVIKGERVIEIEQPDQEGNMVLVERRRSRTPKDAAIGLALLDTLTGGEMGLVPRVSQQSKGAPELYARWAPAVDHRIIASNTPPQEVTPATPVTPVPEFPLVELVTREDYTEDHSDDEEF